MSIIAQIGPNISARRKYLGKSLQEVADAAGTSKSHVWELESGRAVNPTISMLLSLCGALSMSLNDILGCDVSQPSMTEQELELIAHHRRIFGKAGEK